MQYGSTGNQDQGQGHGPGRVGSEQGLQHMLY